MPAHPWRYTLYRRLRRCACRRRGGAPPRKRRWYSSFLITLAVGLLFAWTAVSFLEARLRPIVEEAASAQLRNLITAVIESAVAADLSERAVGYSDFVSVQRDDSGAITALSADTAGMNLLRSELVEQVLEALDGVDVSVIEIPLGSLFDSEVVWARGPAIRARAMWVGTVSAEFESEFSSAGVNQTIHRIWLEVSVPVTLLLPGGKLEVPVDTRVSVAETVIVGQVPDTYLQLEP